MLHTEPSELLCERLMIFRCTNTEDFIQHNSRLIPRRAEMPQNIQPQKIAIRYISKTIHTKYSITYNPPWVVYIMKNSTDKSLPTLSHRGLLQNSVQFCNLFDVKLHRQTTLPLWHIQAFTHSQ
jgi:hypothetical protein